MKILNNLWVSLGRSIHDLIQEIEEAVPKLVTRSVETLAEVLPPPRVIYALDGWSPYLSRWYFLGRPKMADGSDPFDQWGNKRPEATTGVGPTLVLHRFHRGDLERELHNHPVEFAASLVLSGGYIEARRTPDGFVRSRFVRPGSFNVLRKDDFHRVELLRGTTAWTLFFMMPRSSSWGFWDPLTKAYEDHVAYFQARQGM